MTWETENQYQTLKNAGIEIPVIDVLYLAGCAVNGTVPDAARIQEMDLPAVYAVAKAHYLSAVAAYALETAGIHDERFEQARVGAIRKCAMMDDDQESVLEALEKAGIWYMPMKGAILKDLYPAYGIREMSDRDILFDASRAADVRTIMESLGFTTSKYNHGYHDCYQKEPVSDFEMHREIISPYAGKKIYFYYRNVKDRLLKDDEKQQGWHFCPEDFYVFLMAHEYRHYSMSGTGLRSMLDTYVYLQKIPMKMEYIAGETNKLGINAFEETGRSLAIHLFQGGELTADEISMLRYCISSGAYGNQRNRMQNILSKNGRIGYFFSRLTIPYHGMVELYPVLRKVPLLYPACWGHRLIHALFYKRERLVYQLKVGLKKKEKLS